MRISDSIEGLGTKITKKLPAAIKASIPIPALDTTQQTSQEGQKESTPVETGKGGFPIIPVAVIGGSTLLGWLVSSAASAKTWKIIVGTLGFGGAGAALWYFFLRKMLAEEPEKAASAEELPKSEPKPPTPVEEAIKGNACLGPVDSRLKSLLPLWTELKAKGWRLVKDSGTKAKPKYDLYICPPGVYPAGAQPVLTAR